MSPFDVVLNQSPKGKGVKSREEIDEFSDVDVNCTSANENSTTDTIHEEEVNNGNNINIISARLSIGNINKKKDKSELKKESSSALKSPSLSKRGPLKRSESGLNFILEDNDEIGESLNNSDHSYDLKAGSISSYNSNANLLVQGVPDLSVRPQSRKLYLGIEGITKNYNTNAAINVAAVNVASTSGPLTLSLPAPGGIASSINTNSSGSFANSKAPRSAGTRYLSLSSPPGLDGGDGNAENNLEDTQNNCTDAISPGF